MLQEAADGKDRIQDLEEADRDNQEEIRALTEELDTVQESWNKAMAVNAELRTRLQALLGVAFSLDEVAEESAELENH